jgi:hypothetical protein
MSQIVKGSAEWFAAKKKARADLDTRLALGLPHSSEPLPEVGVSLPKAEPTVKKSRASKPKAEPKA